MSDESIVITLQDKIDASISNKLDDISNAAIGADVALKTLQENLAALNSGSLTVLNENLVQTSASTDELTASQSAALAAIEALGTAESAAATSGDTLSIANETATATSQALSAAALEAALATQQLVQAENQTAISAEQLMQAQNATAISAEKVAQAQNATAITAQNVARATDQATLAALRLSNAQNAVVTGSNSANTGMNNFGGTMERVAIRSVARLLVMTLAIQGTISATEALANSEQTLLDAENKLAEDDAKYSVTASTLGKSIKDEIELQKEGGSSYKNSGDQHERLRILKAELMGQGPEYRSMLQNENLSYKDILISLKEINAEKIKELDTQITETTNKGPDTGVWNSFLKIVDSATQSLFQMNEGMIGIQDTSKDGSLLGNITKAADITKLQQYNDTLNKLYELRAKLMKGTAEINGAYDKPNTDTESRALAIAKTTAELEKQQNALKMLQPQREEYNQLEQIEITFANKKHPLMQKEIDLFSNLINSNVEYNKIATQRDAIINAESGPYDTYVNTLAGAKEALDRNTISQEAYNSTVSVATENFNNFLDPLKQTNKSLQDQGDLLEYVGNEQQIETRMQSLRNQLMIKNPDLWKQESEAIKENITNLIKQTEENKQANVIYDDTTGKLNTFTAQVEALTKAMKTMSNSDVNTSKVGMFGSMFENSQSELNSQVTEYNKFLKQIDTLHAKGLMTEKERDQAAYVAKVKLDETKYKTQLNFASDFFGNIATLENSGDRTLFEIGKAAAIAQATVSGRVAYLKALEAGPVLGPILAASTMVATAAAIAQIMNTKMSGYEAGGYTGNGGTSQVAGIVHGQEFVVNSAGTAANRPILEAMNSGKSVSVGSGVNVSIANYGTSKEFEVQQDENQIRIIAKDEANKAVKTQTPSLVASHIANSNSLISKSLKQNTTTNRRY